MRFRSLMIYVKTDAEVELLREANQLVSKTLAEVAVHIRPGVTTLRLDAIAEEFIVHTVHFLPSRDMPDSRTLSAHL